MEYLTVAKLILALPWLGYLCYWDCRTRELPNAWVFGGAAVMLVVAFAADFHYGIGSLITGFLSSLFLLLPFFLRAAGAGDVKMLFAAGIFAGAGNTLNLILLVSIAGFILALFMLAAKQVDSSRLKHYLHCLFDFRYDRAAGRAALPDRNSEKCRVPFGVAIAAGLFFNLLVQIYFSMRGLK